MWGFSRKTRKTDDQSSRPVGRAGIRCYVVGDVHGRLDLLEQLGGMIDRHERGRPALETVVVLLGDLIDRGPDTKGVLNYVLSQQDSGRRHIALCGNHEEMLIHSLSGSRQALARWYANGGDAAMRSYGLDPLKLPADDPAGLLRNLEAAIPSRHRQFVRSLPDSVRFGDYFLVHAGIRPGIPLDQQKPQDLRWIRSEFLNSDQPHEAHIVHGHSNLAAAEFHSNRTAIDTSAHESGVLTALWIEGAERGLLATGEVKGDLAPARTRATA